MRVLSARLDTVDLGPGRLKAAWGEVAQRLVLRLCLTDEIGRASLGEAAPMSPYSPDDLAGATAELTGAIATGALLYESPIEGPGDVAALLETLGLGPSASHAIDQALLGLLALRADRSVASLLTERPRSGVCSHALVRDLAEARRAMGRGVSALKVKLGVRSLGDDLAWLKGLRRALGPEPVLRVDINGAWSLEEARRAWRPLGDLGVDIAEDPIEAGDLAGLRELRALGGPRIAVDQGCRSETELRALLKEDAADLVVIKPMAVGGLQRARDLAQLAAKAGLGVMVTTSLGSALDREAAMAVARSVPPGALEICGLDHVASVWSGHEALRGTVPNPIASAAMARGDALALVMGEETRTWKELAQAASQIAGSLAGAGLAPGDTIALCGRPSAAWIEALYAVSWLGAVAAPVASAVDRALLERLGARAVLSEDPSAVAKGNWRVFGLEDEPAGTPAPEQPWHLDGALVRLLTSGTTGEPQIVTLSAGQVLFGALGSGLRLGHGPGDRWLCCLPLHHIGGLSIPYRAAVAATSLELHDGFDADRVHEALSRREISHVSLVPEMLRRLLERDPSPVWPKLRAVLVGGAATDPELHERARAAGLPLALSWGMTETAAQVATTYPGAAGGENLPTLAFARVRRDPWGQLFVSGPQAGGREIGTGDRGTVTEVGVRISGRADGVITSGALRLDPGKIVAALERLVGVERAHVVGRMDPRWGHRPVAALVPTGAPLSRGELLRGLEAHLERVEIPDAWVWVDALPLGDLGKVSGGRVLEMIEEAQAIQPSPELVRKGDGLEGGQVDERVDLFGRGPKHAVAGTTDLEGEGQGAVAERRDPPGDRQTIVERHGPLEVGLGVDERHAPSVPLEDRGPMGIHGQKQLLEGHMNVLEHAAVEGYSSAVDLVKTHRELVSEGHEAGSSQRDETPGVPDATPLEGTR
jgi:O-succinylbenzoic acid--CoA ligase